MRRALTLFRRHAAFAFEASARNMQYVKRRLRPFSILASVGFPLYYYIWRDVFPQPYENLYLRLVGSALFLPLVFHDRWPEALQKYLPAYWYGATLYALPFFFTFMLLKSGGSEVWLESALIAVFVMVLLLDWLMLILQFAIGVGAATYVYWLIGDPKPVGNFIFAQQAIFTFAIVIGAIANYDLERIRFEQERAMLATASSVAHELRTPLLAIRTGAAGLSRFLPGLLDVYAMAKREKLPIPAIRNAYLFSMRGVLGRIEQEALHSNAIIDLMLASARFSSGHGQPLSRCSIVQCVETALSRYPFRDRERDRVSCDWNAGFDFQGSEILMVHVLFNLLKNALQPTGGKDVEITICAGRFGRIGRLVFRDTGTGISPDALPHIFTLFYTSSSTADDVNPGTGIGLAFCRDVMREFGGTINCSSIKGLYTEFILTFPLL